MLPYFAHSTVNQHRLQILGMLTAYYLELGIELVPMLMGLTKVLLPVYNETSN